MSEEIRHPFIEHLESLRENRGALASLRRGMGQEPGSAPAMYPYVVPWLPASASQSTEEAYYLCAAFFAYHPRAGGRGNLGAAFRIAAGGENDATAVERRFTALLAAHPDDLPFYLRQAISYLKSKEIAIDWHTLFFDLQQWHFDDHRVQKRWAKEYWGWKSDREGA